MIHIITSSIVATCIDVIFDLCSIFTPWVLQNQDDDSSDEDNDDVMFPRSETGEAFSGSDEEEDRQDGEDGDKNDEGEDGTGGDSNDEGNLSDDAPPKRRKKDSYDYMDDFIDDSEFIEMVEGGDKRKSTHQGFVIYQGKIERTGTLEEDNGRKVRCLPIFASLYENARGVPVEEHK